MNRLNYFKAHLAPISTCETRDQSYGDGALKWIGISMHPVGSAKVDCGRRGRMHVAFRARRLAERMRVEAKFPGRVGELGAVQSPRAKNNRFEPRARHPNRTFRPQIPVRSRRRSFALGAIRAYL
jgi:hypothetical protein